jgi:mRNA interferase MazF
MADPCRSEVWLTDLGTGRGREQSGQRPALVLSIDGFNAFGMGPSSIRNGPADAKGKSIPEQT